MKVAVVIPCYCVADSVLKLLEHIPDFVERIYCVDDHCPQQSGNLILESCVDPRVQVIHHQVNQGVGGAMITGYRAALDDKMAMIVKLDGDGQMDPALIPRFIKPIEAGESDYCKGNRFYRPATLLGMPKERLIGNLILSFLTKLSSGYWHSIDPTNGYTAIHSTALELLPLESIDRSYFFEEDMLFRLNVIRAVVRDIPMTAVYNGAQSHLRLRQVVLSFAAKHLANFFKRMIYNYYVRDFNLASIEWPVGIGCLAFSLIFGTTQWINSVVKDEFASAGTVMLAALPFIVGIQMILSAFNIDIQNTPRYPLQRQLSDENPFTENTDGESMGQSDKS